VLLGEGDDPRLTGTSTMPLPTSTGPPLPLRESTFATAGIVDR
jgi:hypothetical protein